MRCDIVLGTPQPKQREFLLAKERFVAYGGARGGGKSWVVREKAKRMAVKWPGIRILILRRRYKDILDNHILPLQKDIPTQIAKYKETEHAFVFYNGSRIKCSYCESRGDALQYQGQEYDIIFMEEATQFEFWVFEILKACIRGANTFPKRMYLTCNPDGIGFLWVKRLFVEREFLPNEDPRDYVFIQANIDDNMALKYYDPDYVRMLDSLSEDLRRRWRDGEWDVVSGQYFDEFRRHIHVIDPFPVPPEWRRYASIDYGLDRFVCLWWAVAPSGDIYCYREVAVSDATISEAAKLYIDRVSYIDKDTGERKREKIHAILAPPDLWNRTQETGRSKAMIFGENGVSLTTSNNDREAGWLALKELLSWERSEESDAEDIVLRHEKVKKEPRLHIFTNCAELIKCLPNLIRDDKHPTDCAIEPHDITHAPDAARYFAIYYIKPANGLAERRVPYRKDLLEDYRRATPEERKKIAEKMGGRPL